MVCHKRYHKHWARLRFFFLSLMPTRAERCLTWSSQDESIRNVSSRCLTNLRPSSNSRFAHHVFRCFFICCSPLEPFSGMMIGIPWNSQIMRWTSKRCCPMSLMGLNASPLHERDVGRQRMWCSPLFSNDVLKEHVFFAQCCCTLWIWGRRQIRKNTNVITVYKLYL